MAERVLCEFQLLRWVPDAVRGEFANVGVVLREAAPSGRVAVRFARSWSRIRAMDGEFDPRLMHELAEELAQRLVKGEQDSDRRALLTVARSSFSTGLQMTEPQGCLAETMEAEMTRLLRMYVEPQTAEREATAEEASGRTGLARGMRREFERAGVWALMRKGIAAAEYTGAGDRLRVDCGYRVEADGERAVRMLHAVSLSKDAEGAKVLAFSAASLRHGVLRREGAALRLTAVVESEAEVASVDTWRFAVEAMQEAGMEVRTRFELPNLAWAARRELQM